MTYAELFARVGALVPDTWTYAVEVNTFRHVHADGPDIRTRWRVSVLPPEGGCDQVLCGTPEEALAAVAAILPRVDKTGAGELVGDARVACEHGNVLASEDGCDECELERKRTEDSDRTEVAV